MKALPSKVAQVEAAKLNEDEMTLIIKRFKTTSIITMTRHKKNMGRRKGRRTTERARRTSEKSGTPTVLHPTLMMKD
jgi:hypothetical protein